jgi:SprT-like family
MKTAAITVTEYQGFQKAYDFFNRELFGGNLPQVLVTLQRHARTYGYFSPQRFNGRIDKTAVHELALNPDGFAGRTDEMILSTLVHEMCHVWQQIHGKAPRKGYHDRQWAGKMREIGLQPSSTGEEGGKETGQSVSHYILPKGRFATAYAKLAASGFQLHWQSVPASEQGKAKKASKMKFTCPECGQNAWAKPDAHLLCGECFDEGKGDSCFMLAEQSVDRPAPTPA